MKYIVLLIGINDIGWSPASALVRADDLIEGYRQLIARAEARGLTIYGATLMPFEGASYFSAARESVRQAVNNWIRGSGAFDAVIDFDAAMRDPARPARLRPTYDSGDHLHPNDLGYQAMANAVPLTLFSATAATAPAPEETLAPASAP